MRHVQQLPLIVFLVMTFFTGFHAHAQMGSVARAVDTSAAPSSAVFKSFREWKLDKVAEIQNKIKVLQEQKEVLKMARVEPRRIAKTNMEAGLSEEIQIEKIDRQIQQEQMKMSLTADLTVSDYFVGYITKVDNQKAAIKEISGRLSAEEVAELMDAYANSVFGTQGQGSIKGASVQENGNFYK